MGVRTLKRGTQLCTAFVVVALVLALGQAQASRGFHPATAAKVLSLREHAVLHVVQKSGSSYEARGGVTGTLSGSLTVSMVVTSAERMKSSFSASERSGTLSGKGLASFRVAGTRLNFSGSASVSGGNGRFSHARGSLQVQGTLDRVHKTMNLTIVGNVTT